jgi:hypothetical protein
MAAGCGCGCGACAHLPHAMGVHAVPLRRRDEGDFARRAPKRSTVARIDARLVRPRAVERGGRAERGGGL